MAICPFISARARPAHLGHGGRGDLIGLGVQDAQAVELDAQGSGRGPDSRFRTDQERTDPTPLQRDAQGLDHGWIIGTGDGDGRRLGSCVSSLVKFVEPRKRKHEVEDSRWQIPDGK